MCLRYARIQPGERRKPSSHGVTRRINRAPIIMRNPTSISRTVTRSKNKGSMRSLKSMMKVSDSSTAATTAIKAELMRGRFRRRVMPCAVLSPGEEGLGDISVISPSSHPDSTPVSFLSADEVDEVATREHRTSTEPADHLRFALYRSLRGVRDRSAATSRGHCNTSASLCDGAFHPRVCRGRLLSEWAAWSRSSWVRTLMSVPLGKY